MLTPVNMAPMATLSSVVLPETPRHRQHLNRKHDGVLYVRFVHMDQSTHIQNSSTAKLGNTCNPIRPPEPMSAGHKKNSDGV